MGGRWFFAIVAGAVVGVVAYAVGLPAPVVYVLRSVARHLAHGELPPLLPSFGIIRLVTGPLGTGKSYYGVRKAVEAMQRGKIVITNFSMEPDWVRQVVTRGKLRKETPKLEERIARFERRYLRVDSLPELMKVRIRPEAPFAFERKPGEWVLKEGSGVVLLDEAHRWMNARGWTEEGRKEILEFFALARKLGFHVYLIAQRAENLDVQVRELFEDHVHLNNLKRSVRVLGLPVVPMNFFVASWRNHAYPQEVVKFERYRLRWFKRLYDTMDTRSFGLTDFGDGSQLLLPRRAPSDGDPDGTPDGGTAWAVPPAVAPASPPADESSVQLPVADPGHLVVPPDPAL
jgi:hypothetical protein